MRIFLVISLVLLSLYAEAQCFSSPGNPIGGTLNTGATKKGLLRVNLFNRYSFTRHYYEGSKKIDNLLYRKAHYDYVGVLMAVGLTSRLTFENEAGYFPFKTVYYNYPYSLYEDNKTGSGPSNWVPSFKYLIYKQEDKRFYLSASAGLKVPFSRSFQSQNNVELPVDVQPSTGAYGGVFQLFLMKEYSFTGTRLFAVSRYEHNGENLKRYRFGDAFIQSLFYSKHLYLGNTPFPENWTVIMQVRFEWRDKNTVYLKSFPGNEWLKHTAAGTGGYALLLSPQLNYTIKSKWNLSLSGEIPAYQYLNQKQLGRGWAILFNVSTDIKMWN